MLFRSWVINEGGAGQVTGFQNVAGLTNLALVESSISNEWNSSDGIFLEVYEGAAVTAQTNALPSGQTLGYWNEQFHARRRAAWTKKNSRAPLISFNKINRRLCCSADTRSNRAANWRRPTSGPAFVAVAAPTC